MNEFVKKKTSAVSIFSLLIFTLYAIESIWFERICFEQLFSE